MKNSQTSTSLFDTMLEARISLILIESLSKGSKYFANNICDNIDRRLTDNNKIRAAYIDILGVSDFQLGYTVVALRWGSSLQETNLGWRYLDWASFCCVKQIA
jgi:Ca2+/Na+ antiporter